MNGSSFLDKYANATSRPNPAASRAAQERLDGTDEGGEDRGCYGVLRGVRERSVMLELRKANGNVRAIPYTWIEALDYDPSEGVTVRAPVAVIRIKGRNLNEQGPGGISLFGGLCRHRVPWIKEASRATAIAAEHLSPIIDAIEWS